MRLARLTPKIREAIEKSMARLDPSLRWEIKDFAGGVITGKAPALERHTTALYKAFAPLRAALPSKVTVYRGEPKSPPGIKRKWLSWSPAASMAAKFSRGRDMHVVEATVPSSDIVAGIISPHNDNYIEYLVFDRPEYHAQGTGNPRWYRVEQDLGPPWTPERESDESWMPKVRRQIESLGGKVTKVRGYVEEDGFSPMMMFVLPPGVDPSVLETRTIKVEDYGERPDYFGRMTARVARRYLVASQTFYRIQPPGARLRPSKDMDGNPLDRPGMFVFDDLGDLRETVKLWAPRHLENVEVVEIRYMGETWEHHLEGGTLIDPARARITARFPIEDVLNRRQASSNILQSLPVAISPWSSKQGARS